MKMKFCHRCGTTKPLDDFHRNRTVSDGRQSRCKDCARNTMREHQRQNPEKNRARAAAHRVLHPRDPDREREIHRAYYEAHREECIARSMTWKQANRERCRELDRARHAADPEKYREKDRAWYAARKARKAMQEGDKPIA
jgi:superfamily II helicase